MAAVELWRSFGLAATCWSTWATFATSRLSPAEIHSVDCGGEGHLHMQVCQAWEDRRAHGLAAWPSPSEEASLQSNVRSLGGKFGMVAQSAPNRGQKRPLGATSLNSTQLAFDAEKFHFGKVGVDEILLCFNPRQETACQHTATMNTCHLPQYASIKAAGAEACGMDTEDPAVVIINKNPVSRNHIIFVPSIREELPQVLTLNALALGLAFAMRASGRMWLSFNSIGAGASVNHLHLQAFFPGLGTNSETPVEYPLEVYSRVRRGFVAAAEPRGPISLARTQDWPLRGWSFTWDDESVLAIDTGLAERRLAEFVHAFLAKLQAMDMAHNVLIGSGGRRVIVFPRRVLFEQGTDVSQMQVAGHEVLGWWIVPKASHDLDEDAARKLLAKAALLEAEQGQVIAALQEIGWRLHEDAKKPHTEIS
eukprot:TRINITY_DN43141_c0_g1_i1.p1 TRINITY_DN43141_c0_g1~~TRINITY_DN43141_c0_g1_i1.p1  ORF type:complete len:422 (-),score=96.18 TRINITY_DN43141_c0_g1_i1:69-1334(-)